MATEEQLRYLVEVQDRDLKDLQKRIKETNDVLGKDTPAAGDKASKSFSGFGATTSLLAGGALVGLVAGAKQAGAAASDLGEQVNKAGAVFGPAGKDVVAWSKTTARALGIGQTAALEAAGTYGNMLVPMGIAPARAAKLSRSMVGLAADMASFNNASPEETLQAISSGLSGETEPLRRFGVFLNADRVAAEALASGLVKPVKNMEGIREANTKLDLAQRRYTEAVKEHGEESEEAIRAGLARTTAEKGLKKAMEGSKPKIDAAAKAQATYSLIMSDMQKSGSVGDFAKTSDGLANSQRIQAAVQEDLNVSLGQNFLPIQQAVNQVIAAATGLLAGHQTATLVLVGVVASLAAGVFLVNGALKVHAAYTAVSAAATAAFSKEGRIATAMSKAWAAGQWLLNAALSANPIALVVIAIALLAAAFFTAWKKSETFREIVTGALDVVKSTASSVANWFRDTFEPIFSAAIGAVRAVFGGLRTAFEWFRDHAGTIWSGVQLALVGPITLVKGYIAAVDLAVDAVRTGFGWVRDNAGRIWTAVSGAMEKPLGAMKTAIDAVGDGLGKIRDVFEWLVDNAKRITDKLDPLTSVLGKVGGFLGKIRDVGDVAAGFNSATASAARGRLEGGGGSLGGLAPQTQRLFEFLQSQFGGLVMTSGFRTEAQNAAVGGAPNSDHKTGRAFDVVPAGGWTSAGIANLDRIAAFLASSPLVRWIGWRGVPGHGPGDHLHVSTFDSGGDLLPGWTLAFNGTGRAERVVGPGGGRDGLTVNVIFRDSIVGSETQLAEKIRRILFATPELSILGDRA